MYLNTELKMNGKNAFRRNYWPCVGAALVVELLTGGGVPVVSNASDVSDLADIFSGSTSATEHIMGIPTGLAGMAVSILGVIAILAVLFSFFCQQCNRSRWRPFLHSEQRFRTDGWNNF